MHPIKGIFDFNHLKRIHHFIFQDVYDWAGKTRTVDIGKNNLFCRSQFIDSYAQTVFSDFYSSCKATGTDQEQFIKVLASHYADMNALHPFREGNGRAQREFTRELCLKCGYVFDLTETTHEEMLDASISSFNRGDNTKFERIFSRCVIPNSEYENLQKKLYTQIMILSRDDLG
jgi:cell filamentation protein